MKINTLVFLAVLLTICNLSKCTLKSSKYYAYGADGNKVGYLSSREGDFFNKNHAYIGTVEKDGSAKNKSGDLLGKANTQSGELLNKDSGEVVAKVDFNSGNVSSADGTLIGKVDKKDHPKMTRIASGLYFLVLNKN